MIPIFILAVGLPLGWGQLNVGDTALIVMQLVGVVIFALASIIDQLDREIARTRDFVTGFGKLTDPLADKVLVITAFIMLVDQGKTPGRAVTVIVCRELAVTGLRLLLVEHEEVVAAAWSGKVKTATRAVAIISLFINSIPFNLISILIDQIMLYTRLIFAIYSGTDYFIKNSGVLKGSMWALFCGRSDSSVPDRVEIIWSYNEKRTGERLVHGSALLSF